MSNDPTPSSAAKTTPDSVSTEDDPPVREPGSVTSTKHNTPADGSEFKADN